MEVWKDIKDYEGLYQVSNLGRVKSIPKIKKANKGEFTTKEIILRPGVHQGYERVVLTKNGIRSTKKMHRLVITAFLGEEKDLSVNHIDSNRSNNNIENLEWVTHLENIRHARRNNRYPKLTLSLSHKNKLKEVNSKKVVCTKSGKIYDSIREASIQVNIKESTLRHYLLGSRKNKTNLIYM